MQMDFTPPNFAVVQTDDGELDSVMAARLLAEPLNSPLADLIARIAIARGILAEDLSKAEAQRCAAALTNGGIVVRVVTKEALIDPPPPYVLRSASFNDGVLTFATIPQKGAVFEGSVPWSEFLWLDCVSVQRLEHEEYQDRKIVPDDEDGARIVHCKSKRLKTVRPLQIDLVSNDPWLWLQIRDDSFQFAATGLVMQPNRRENMHYLAIAMGQRAKAARLGPGMKWFSDQTALRETRMVNAVSHYNHLRWQLTKLRLDS